MADESKKIKFTFEVDSLSLDRLKTSVKDITTLMEKLVKTASGLSMGGGGGVGIGAGPMSQGQRTQAIKTTSSQATGGLSQAFIDSSKAMSNMANISKDSLRVMSDAVSRGIGEQKRSLQSLDSDIANLTKKYETLGKLKSQLGGAGPGFEKLEGRQDEITRALLQAETKKQEETKNLKTLMDQSVRMRGDVPVSGIGPMMGPEMRPPGMMERFMGGMSGMTLGPTTLGGWLGSAGAMAGVANWGFNEYRGGQMHEMSAMSARADMVRPSLEKLSRGDVSEINAARLAMEGKGRGGAFSGGKEYSENYKSQFSGTSSKIETAMVQVGEALEYTVKTGLAIGTLGLSNLLLAPPTGGLFDSLSDERGNRAPIQKAISATAAEVKRDPLAEKVLQQFQANVPGRVAAQRMLGMGGVAVGESGKYESGFDVLSNKLQARGYDIGQYAGAFSGLRQGAGIDAARENADASMRARASGLGGFDEAIVSGMRRGGGNQLAYGALGGGISAGAGMQLAGAIGGTGFDIMGTTSGLGALAAIQGGMGFTGGAADYNKVAQAQAGLQFGTQLSTGSLDQYQQGVNLANAIKAMPGGGVGAQDFLATGINQTQMLDVISGGELTPAMKAMGLTREDIKAQHEATIRSVAGARGAGYSGTPGGKALEDWMSSGQSLADYTSGMSAKEKSQFRDIAGSTYAIEAGIAPEAGIGEFGAEMGIGSKLKKGGVGGGLDKDSLEAQQLKGYAAAQAKLTAKLLELAEGGLSKSFERIPQAMDALADVPTNFTKTAEQMMEAMTGVSAVFNKFAGEHLTPDELKASKAQAKLLTGKEKRRL